jgi:hypothetical protein
MERIMVRLSGMSFEIDDTIAISEPVRVPGSGSSFSKDSETGTVIALESSYTEPCNRAIRAT